MANAAMAKAKPMTQTEIRGQVRDNEDVIRHIILKNLNREGFKVVPETFKLSRKSFCKLNGKGMAFIMEYVVAVENKMPGMEDVRVAGDFDFYIGGLKKGDAIFTGKKCNVDILASYEVEACLPAYTMEAGAWN